MDEKIPEPLSRPVETTKPGANIPPAPPASNATVSSTPMGMPASNVGKPGRGKSVLVVLLIIILMASTAAFGYLWWQARSAQAQVAQAQADKANAEKKATEAEAKVKELESKSVAKPEDMEVSDSDMIIMAAKRYDAVRTDYDAAKVIYGTPKISAQDKKFATIAVTEQGDAGGATYILKKVDVDWIVIIAGQQNTITAEQRSEYGIPADIK